MPDFLPPDPLFASRVRASFARQQVMHTLGASLTLVEPGVVEIALPFHRDLTQQHGFLHAGIIGTILDSACGYAAFSLMPADKAVLSVEYKINLLAPAKGQRFVAKAQVIKAGRNLTVCTGEAFAYDHEKPKLVATMTATMMAIPEREDLQG